VQEDVIYAKLTTVFHQVFDEEDIVVTPTLSADDVESWDSLRHIRLVMTVEKAFHVKLSAEDLEKMKNIADLVQLVKGKL
jgi:acyl carrier protein